MAGIIIGDKPKYKQIEHSCKYLDAVLEAVKSAQRHLKCVDTFIEVQSIESVSDVKWELDQIEDHIEYARSIHEQLRSALEEKEKMIEKIKDVLD